MNGSFRAIDGVGGGGGGCCSAPVVMLDDAAVCGLAIDAPPVYHGCICNDMFVNISPSNLILTLFLLFCRVKI